MTARTLEGLDMQAPSARSNAIGRVLLAASLVAAALVAWAGIAAAQAPPAVTYDADGCVADPTGDTTLQGSETATAFARADITRFCVVASATATTFTLTPQEATNPASDPSWDSVDTFANWLLDEDADGSGDTDVIYGVESNGQLEVVVLDRLDVERCNGTGSGTLTDRTAARFDGARYIAEVPAACLQGAQPPRANAGMTYDTNAGDIDSAVHEDFAPSDGTFAGPSGPAAVIPEAPPGLLPVTAALLLLLGAGQLRRRRRDASATRAS